GRFFRYSFSSLHRVCCGGTTFRRAARPGHGGRVRSALQGASMRRKTVLVLFLLAALLAAPLASAAPPPGGSPPVAASGVGVIPDVLSQFWSYLKGIWSKEGCHIDPDGRCVTTAVGSGCQIDPNGRCVTGTAPVTSADVGCQIDPFGRCVS